MDAMAMPTWLKTKCYETVVQPAIIYGTKCWETVREHVHKMSVTNMHILRWMYGKTCEDKIGNERKRKYLGTTPLKDKIETTSMVRSHYKEIIHNANKEVSGYGDYYGV